VTRDAYKEAAKKSDGMGDQSKPYTVPVVDEVLWRTLYSARHFMVSVIAKQLSLPARRPNRLFVPPPALGPAARAAATNLGALSQQLLAIFVPAEVDAVEGQTDNAIAQKLRYLNEILELCFRAHVDEKHHHVRMLCVDRLHKAGVFGGSLHSAARYVLAVARRISLRPAHDKEKSDILLEAMQKCMQNLTQYLDKLSSLKWIKSAPAPPTSMPPSERGETSEGTPPAAVQQVAAFVANGTEEPPADGTGTAEPMICRGCPNARDCAGRDANTCSSDNSTT
jgi:hypothetical protein